MSAVTVPHAHFKHLLMKIKYFSNEHKVLYATVRSRYLMDMSYYLLASFTMFTRPETTNCPESFSLYSYVFINETPKNSQRPRKLCF